MTEDRTVAQLLAIAEAVDAWAGMDWHVAYDVGPQLTCSEADALARIFKAAGHSTWAESWIAGHAEGDQECGEQSDQCEELDDDLHSHFKDEAGAEKYVAEHL